MRTLRRSGLSMIILLVAATGGTAAACAGKEGSVPAASGDGGPPGPGTTGCPATAPWTRTTANGPKNPCPHEGQLCEYGTDWDPRCNTVVVCSNGEWAVPILSNGGGPPMCGSSSPPIPPNPADCPATRDALIVGQSCSTQSTCAYDGSVCSCGVFCPSYPVGEQNCNPDAGITMNCCDRSKPPTWYCFNGPPFCTTPRPHLGDPCSPSGAQCAIGPPAECAQTLLECTNGIWQVPNNECPISTARAKRGITYLAPGDAAHLHDALLDVRLATYQYKVGDPSTHLGFIIEDMPAESPAVLASRDRVDLYGYVSMAVAAIQEQQKQIDALQRQLAEVKRDCR